VEVPVYPGLISTEYTESGGRNEPPWTQKGCQKIPKGRGTNPSPFVVLFGHDPIPKPSREANGADNPNGRAEPAGRLSVPTAEEEPGV
jgi:hypothetical protein